MARATRNQTRQARNRLRHLFNVYESTWDESLNSRVAVRRSLERWAKKEKITAEVVRKVCSDFKSEGVLAKDAEQSQTEDEAEWDKRKQARVAEQMRREAEQKEEKRAKVAAEMHAQAYEEINSNRFVARNIRRLATDSDESCNDTCVCTRAQNHTCGCAAFEVLCSSRCACHGKCLTNSFENARRVRVDEVDRDEVGFGLFADEEIDASAFVGEYVGEYVAFEEKVRYEYAVRLGEGILIDASAAGNDMRFANHSCDPNAEMNKKFDPETGFERAGLYALRHISKGEEITFKYSDKLWFECLCDACVNRT